MPNEIIKKSFEFQTANKVANFISGSDEWVRFRKSGIGGSDAGTIMRVNPYSSWGKLWLEKTGRIEGFKGNAATEYGHKMEPWIREQVPGILRFEESVEVTVFECEGTYEHKEHKFMRANVDGIIHHPDYGLIGLEIKTANARQWAKWDNDSVPESYYCQIQHYMFVLGLPKFYIFVLMDAQIKYRVVERNEEFIKKMIEEESKFFKHIEDDVAPEPNEFDAESLAEFYKAVDGEIINESSEEFAAQMEQLLEIKAQIKELEEKKEELENIIKVKISTHEGVFSHGFLATWKKSKDSVRLDTDKLKAEYPEVFAACQKTTEGSRRFLIKSGK